MSEIFCFTLQTELMLGVKREFSVKDFVMRNISVYKMVANAPCKDFVRFTHVSADNVILPPFYNSEGPDYYPTCDAFDLGKEFEPHECRHGATMIGKYLGLVPKGFNQGGLLPFCLTLFGRAI